ncbi:hypothetical protein [Pseudomonas putida]|uniref:hypothetical protein n=1 Tax=Pseudomonas putida TaxID=303 RepID=UPI003D979DD9
MSINVIWEHMRDRYGAATGPVETDVEYKLYRGDLELGGAATRVMVGFAVPIVDPENPDPGTPNLHPLAVYGESGEANKLIASDENKPVVAQIELPDPLPDGLQLQVQWNGEDIGAPYEVDTDNVSAGEVIDVPITDWDIIKKHGNDQKMPVKYIATHPDFNNPQEPEEPTEVDIRFFVITLRLAEPQQLINRRLTCCSLIRDEADSTKIGFKYFIPPSDYLKEGMTVKLEWRASTTYASPVEVEDAAKSVTYGPISAEEATDGFYWLVEPYDKHLLPTWGGPSNQLGKGEVRYGLNIGGTDVFSLYSDTQVGLSAGAGTCDPDNPCPID